MSASSLRKPLLLAGAFLALWLGLRYLLPILFPFLLGTLIALAAEPVVGLAQRKLRLPRAAAVGLGVTAMLILVAAVLSLVGALLVKELGRLAGVLPDLADTARQGTVQVQDWLVDLTQRTPQSVQPMLTQTVLNFFDDGTALMEQVSQRLPGVVTTVLGWVPDGALGLGTGLLAGFMISARLPQLKQLVQNRLPKSWREQYLPALRRMRKTLGGWLRAQVKLAAVTWCVVTVGFLVLGISYAPVWAAAVALVDAVPLLGTGTVLLPWALACVLQGNHLRAIGLVCTYGVAAILRTVLEPRLVGRQLGLDPLLTLLALYLGYRFWGFLGMILAPILAAAAKSITAPPRETNEAA